MSDWWQVCVRLFLSQGPDSTEPSLGLWVSRTVVLARLPALLTLSADLWQHWLYAASQTRLHLGLENNNDNGVLEEAKTEWVEKYSGLTLLQLSRNLQQFSWWSNPPWQAPGLAWPAGTREGKNADLSELIQFIECWNACSKSANKLALLGWITLLVIALTKVIADRSEIKCYHCDVFLNINPGSALSLTSSAHCRLCPTLHCP